jgi:uncharacterized OsmC-like protein
MNRPSNEHPIAHMHFKGSKRPGIWLHVKSTKPWGLLYTTMAEPNEIRQAFERNRKVLSIKPSKGQYTTKTSVRLFDGTSCEIVHGPWTFTADVGKTEGGNDAGPGPSVLERAALGSCLAIGYAKYAALYEVPLDSLTVDVEADVDVRGMFGVADVPVTYKGLRYTVTVESSAPEHKIRKVIEDADQNSPVLANFTEPISVKRNVSIVTEKTET